MKILDSKNKITFGWKSSGHAAIVGSALETNPELKMFRAELVNNAVKPDYDEVGFKSNAHLYYAGPETPHSFFDKKGQNNAFAHYQLHVEAMERAIEQGENRTAMEHAGRALHFLQDVGQPHHVKRANLFMKFLERSVHIKFEDYVEKQQGLDIKFKKTNTDISTSNTFNDIFENVVKISDKMVAPTIQNKLLWKSIAQEGLGNSLSATDVFMQKLSILLVNKGVNKIK
jgi:hypothetical protein